MVRPEMSEVALTEELNARNMAAVKEDRKVERKVIKKEIDPFIKTYSKELPFSERDQLQDKGVLKMPKAKLQAIELMKTREVVSIIKDEKISQSVKRYALSESWKAFKKKKALEEKQEARKEKRSEKRKEASQKKQQAEEKVAEQPKAKTKEEIQESIALQAMIEARKKKAEQAKTVDKPKGIVVSLNGSKKAQEAFLNNFKSDLGVKKEEKEQTKKKGIKLSFHKGRGNGDSGR